MNGLLALLDDAYLHEIADHFASLDLPYPPPLAPAGSAALREAGEALVRRGDPARGLPACNDCHGAQMTGLAPFVPGLLGLPRDYLNAQLGAWRSGQRRALPPDCMAQVAQRLSLEDIGAVSAWLAAQPVPAHATAPAAPPTPLPLACGGVAAAAGAASARRDEARQGVDRARRRRGDRAARGDRRRLAQSRRRRRSTRPTPRPRPSDAELVARGEYLVRAGSCYGCHTEPGGAPYAGGRAIETPFGIVNAPNLTADAHRPRRRGAATTSGAPCTTAARATGACSIPPFRIRTTRASTRADADAMFAYLKSLAPVVKQNRPHALRFPFDQPVALAVWRALFFRPAQFEADSARSPQWNRGAYLVETLGHCNACHSRRNVFGATAGPLDLAGGLIPIQNWYAPSLRDDAEAGVGDWPEREVVALLKSGVSARGSVQGPMAEVVARSTQFLSDDDLAAMAAYLRSLPDGADASRRATGDSDAAPCRARPAPSSTRPTAPPATAIAAKASPAPIRRSPAIARSRSRRRPTSSTSSCAAASRRPRRATRVPYGMPPFATVLSDEQVGQVLSHLRASWGHQAPQVSTLDVSRYRGAR